MPWNGRQVLQLSVLLLCVPAQLFISWYYGNSGLERKIAFKTFFDQISEAKIAFLNSELWKYSWWLRLINYPGYNIKPTNGDSPAIEVMKYRSDKGYFATSPEPRSPRPNQVQFRVGQVVTHKTSGYRGVIAGWDSVAKAPEDWLRLMYPKHRSWLSMPNYVVLVDTRDRSPAQMTYVPQENLEVLENTEVLHPKISNHFLGFDGAQYLPRQWLQTLYPED